MAHFWVFLGLILCVIGTDYVSVIEDTTLSQMGAMSVSISISDVEDSITIELSGPSFVYFSIGIGSCVMSDSWALVVPGLTASDGTTPFEQILGDNKAGSTLYSSFTVEKDVTYGLLRTVTFTRSLSVSADLDGSYYAFSTDDDELEVMWAYGTRADYSNHGEYQRDCTTLSFTKTAQSEEQLFSSDWSYLSGHSTASLIFVFILLAVVLIIAAIRYCIEENKWTKIKSLMDTEEYIPI